MSGCSTPIFTICAFFTIKRKKVGVSLNISPKWREKKIKKEKINKFWHNNIHSMNAHEDNEFRRKAQKVFLLHCSIPTDPTSIEAKRYSTIRVVLVLQCLFWTLIPLILHLEVGVLGG